MQTFAIPWRNVPTGAQIVDDTRPVDVGRWIIVGDGVIHAFAYYREVDGVYQRIDDINELVAVVMPEVPDTAQAVLNLMNGGFTIEAAKEE